MEAKKGLKTIKVFSFILSLTSILYISNGFEVFGLHIPIVSYCSFLLGLTLTLVFLYHPAKKQVAGKGIICWYDIICIILALGSTLYIVLFPQLREDALLMGTTTNVAVMACFVLVLLILEVTRRMVNLSMAIIAALFVIHLLFGPHLPGILSTFPFSLERIVTLFYYSTNGIFGLPVTVAFTIIVAFILLGTIIEKSGAGKFITDAAFSLTGKWVGGPAKAAVLGSSAMGTMTGATVANIVTMGTITIPLMKKNGFSADRAAAIECCAGNGGQIMPPVMGIVAFLIAEILGVPYVSVCLAAVFPALLYYVALYVQIHSYSLKLGLKGLPSHELPSLRAVFKEGWFYLVPVIVLIYALGYLHLPVQHCGLLASVTAFIVAIVDFQRRKETRKSLQGLISWTGEVLVGTAKSLLVPAIACAAAGVIIGSIDTSGFGFRLSNMLVKLAGGNLFFLLILTAFASYILGMGMTSVPCYLVLVILVAPAMVKSGVLPIAAHLFVFYWGLMSFITPPVAVGAYVAAGIAKGDPMRTGFIAMRLAFVSYIVPFVFVYNPSLLLNGQWGEIIWTIVTTTIGVTAIAFAFEGYLKKRLSWLERFLLMIGGFIVFLPTTSIHWTVDIIGVAIITATLLWHKKFARFLAKGVTV